MLLKCGLLMFIASVILIGFCGGQDGVREVLLIDGPGGYLPDIRDDVDIDPEMGTGFSTGLGTELDIGLDMDNELNFGRTPSFDEGYYYEDQLVMRSHWSDILDYLSSWESHLRFF